MDESELLRQILREYTTLIEQGPGALERHVKTLETVAGVLQDPAQKNQLYLRAEVLNSLPRERRASSDEIARLLREKYTQYFSPKLQGPDEALPVEALSPAHRIKARRQQALHEAIQRAQATQWGTPVTPPPLAAPSPSTPAGGGTTPIGVTMTSAPPVMHVETATAAPAVGRTITTSFTTPAASPPPLSMQEAARLAGLADTIRDDILKAAQGPNQHVQAIKILDFLGKELTALKGQPGQMTQRAAAVLHTVPPDLRKLIEAGGDDVLAAIELASSRLKAEYAAGQLLEGARRLGQAPLTELLGQEASELARTLRSTTEEGLVKGFTGADPKAQAVWRQIAQKPTFRELATALAPAKDVQATHLRGALARVNPQVISHLEEIAEKARQAAMKATEALPDTTPAVKPLADRPLTAPRAGSLWPWAVPLAITLLAWLLSGKKKREFKWLRYGEDDSLITK